MPKDTTSSTSPRTGRDIQQEMELGLQRLNLSNDIDIDQLVAMGGYADVYEGTLLVKKTNQRVRVAAKKIRCILKKEKEFARAFARELCIWARFDHENILPLIGIAVFDGVPVLAAEWMVNGTMNEYLRQHDGADILSMVQGIACGLEHLHDLGVVHADLKGDNVLIADDGRPMLSDFGISRMLVYSKTVVGTTTLRGTTRWMAPELVKPVTKIEPGHLFHTKATDVWAFGMVIYEAMSGNVPFYTCQSDGQVIASIMNRQIPDRPGSRRIGGKEFDLLWRCCKICWNDDPTARPTMMGARGLVEIRELDKRILEVVVVSNPFVCDSWMSPTGRFLAMRNRDFQSVSILDSETMNRCGPGLTADFEIYSFAWSSTEDHVVTCPYNGILRKWSNVLESPKVVAQSTQKHEEARFEFSADDRFIASFYREVKLLDASNLSLIWEHPGIWGSVAFHPTGNRVIFYSSHSLLDVNIEDPGNITATERKFDHPVCHLVLGIRGTVARTIQGVVKILNADTFEEESSIPYSGCAAIQITPNGKYLLLLLKSKMVVLWDIAANEAVEELWLDVCELLGGLVSRDCRVLRVTGNRDSQLVHLASTNY